MIITCSLSLTILLVTVVDLTPISLGDFGFNFLWRFLEVGSITTQCVALTLPKYEDDKSNHSGSVELTPATKSASGSGDNNIKLSDYVPSYQTTSA